MKVTVIMPVYNTAEYLPEAIESVLKQTHSDFDFIIVNDGSTDNSLEIIESYAQQDPRIKVISQANAGMGEALNRAIEASSTDWILRMDSDDLMLPNRLESQIAFIQSQEYPIKLTCCSAYYMGPKGRVFGRTYCDVLSYEKYKWYLENNETIGLAHIGVAFDRDTILSLGGYRSQFWPADDTDLWNRVAEKGHIIIAQNEVLMKYRVHSGSIITSKFNYGRLQYEWVRACMYARRQGLKEPTRDEFLQEWKSAPLLLRLNRWRKSLSKYYYREAGFDFVRESKLSAIIKLVKAMFLQPSYTLPRLYNQILRK